jgi:two-component system NarL family sensor kinase
LTNRNYHKQLTKHSFWLAVAVFCIYWPILLFSQVQEAKPEISSPIFLKDTAAIISLLRKADALAETNTDSALALAWQAAENSQRLHFTYGYAVALSYCGIYYQIKGDYPLAIQTLQAALKRPISSNKEKHVYLKSLNTLASVYWVYGKADSSAYYCYEAINAIDKLQISNPEIIVGCYIEALRLWLNLNDNPNDLANDKYMQQAVNYLNKAMQLAQTTPDTKADIMFCMAQAKEVFKEYDSSRYYYQNYLQLVAHKGAARNRNDSWASAALANISQLFLHQNNADSAIWYAKAAIAKLPPGGQHFMQSMYASYYIGKGLCMQKKYKEAIAVTLPALANAKAKKIFMLQDMAHEILAEAYQQTGNYKAAFEHQMAYADIKDSLMQKEKMQAISQMEMKYQVAEKTKALAEKDKQLIQNEISILKKDSSIRGKNFWIAGISAGFMLLLLAGIIFYNRIRHQRQLTALEAAQQLQLASMQATLNGEENERRRLAQELHDGIGGQLGGLRLQIDTALMKNKITDTNGDFANIVNRVNQTAADLRKTAHNLMPENLAQEGLTIAAETFCNSIAGSAAFQLQFTTVGITPRLAPHIELALYRMLQELLHNIIKHAQASQVLVQLAFAHPTLVLTVEDDGIGINTLAPNKQTGKGLGLQAMKSRLEAMGGKMDIFSEAGTGTSINIEICTDNKNGA